eukprot:1182958-Prorocentrum_minimum.AAC.2
MQALVRKLVRKRSSVVGSEAATKGTLPVRRGDSKGVRPVRSSTNLMMKRLRRATLLWKLPNRPVISALAITASRNAKMSCAPLSRHRFCRATKIFQRLHTRIARRSLFLLRRMRSLNLHHRWIRLAHLSRYASSSRSMRSTWSQKASSRMRAASTENTTTLESCFCFSRWRSSASRSAASLALSRSCFSARWTIFWPRCSSRAAFLARACVRRSSRTRCISKNIRCLFSGLNCLICSLFTSMRSLCFSADSWAYVAIRSCSFRKSRGLLRSSLSFSSRARRVGPAGCACVLRSREAGPSVDITTCRRAAYSFFCLCALSVSFLISSCKACTGSITTFCFLLCSLGCSRISMCCPSCTTRVTPMCEAAVRRSLAETARLTSDGP